METFASAHLAPSFSYITCRLLQRLQFNYIHLVELYQPMGYLIQCNLWNYPPSFWLRQIMFWFWAGADSELVLPPAWEQLYSHIIHSLYKSSNFLELLWRTMVRSLLLWFSIQRKNVWFNLPKSEQDTPSLVFNGDYVQFQLVLGLDNPTPSPWSKWFFVLDQQRPVSTSQSGTRCPG